MGRIRKPGLTTKARKKKKESKPKKLQKVVGATPTIPYRSCLESFGFNVRTPKAGNLLQTSTLIAEAKLCDHSGTYVSTVP